MTPDDAREGLRVKVVSSPTWGDDEPRHDLAYLLDGRPVTILGPADIDGDVWCRFEDLDGGPHERYIAAKCLAPFEEPATATATATVRVEVRFFVGDRDVTDLVGPLLKEVAP